MGIFRRKVPRDYVPIHPDNIGTNNWIILLEAGTIGGAKAEKLRMATATLEKKIKKKYWSVSDEATARLMIGTFRASARDPKLSHAEALRQSMLAMIDGATSDAEADPRLRAPFVAVGEPAKPQ